MQAPRRVFGLDEPDGVVVIDGVDYPFKRPSRLGLDQKRRLGQIEAETREAEAKFKAEIEKKLKPRAVKGGKPKPPSNEDVIEAALRGDEIRRQMFLDTLEVVLGDAFVAVVKDDTERFGAEALKGLIAYCTEGYREEQTRDPLAGRPEEEVDLAAVSVGTVSLNDSP